MQEPATLSPPHRRFKHRRKVVAGILLAALACGAWRFVISPTYWRVATFPQYQEDYSYAVFYDGLQPCVNGFCLREGKFSFVLRDWQRGREVWRVTSAQPDTRGWPPSDNDEASYAYAASISPSGRVLAVMSAAGRKARVQSWRDGKLLGEVLIPIPPASPPAPTLSFWPHAEKSDHLCSASVRACDDGRCFLTLEMLPAGQKGPVSHLFLVRGGSTVATGATPDYCLLAPDGHSAIRYGGADRLCLLTVSRRRLIFSKDQPLVMCMTCTRGMAVTETGILRLNGSTTPFTGTWEPDEVCPSTTHATIYQENRLRSVEVATGKYWQITLPSDYELQGGDPTEDGRHLLAYYRPEPSRLLQQFVRLVPAFAPQLQERLDPDEAPKYIALYRRPHRRLAAMRIDRYKPSSWWPSPDGRTVVIGTEKGCRLLRYAGP